MKKRNWTTAAVILGIAVLAAAVALMPACDTNPIDACAELDGSSWIVDYTPVTDLPAPCGTPSPATGESIDFTITDDQVHVVWWNEAHTSAIAYDGTITCDDEDFTISWASDPAPAGPGCTLTVSTTIAGSFDSDENEFTATYTMNMDYFGTCGGTDCTNIYNMSAVRQ